MPMVSASTRRSEMPASCARCQTSSRPSGDAGGDGVEEAVVDDLDAAGAQPGRERGGVPVHPQTEAAQPVRAVPDRVHAGHDGEQHLRGADVAGRLLPADVLLTGLQRQPVGGVAVGVDADADQAAGQRPLEALA